MNRKVYYIGIICLLLGSALFLFTSCTYPARNVLNPTIQITDQIGREVLLDKLPQRIISLAPSNTEILYALGLSDRVIAVTDYCNYPTEAKQKPSIGGFSTPNLEEIITLSPDLIMATGMHENRIIPQLEARGLTVMTLDPSTIDQVLEAITLTGKVAGREEMAAKIVENTNQRIGELTAKLDGLPAEQIPAVLYVVWHDPLKTAGSGTLQDELIIKAGGFNIAKKLNDYADISLEAVVQDNPAVIIAGTSHGSGQDQTYRYILTESRLRNINARLNGRIYTVDADLTSRAGPRIIDALEIFAAYIHPDLFL